MNRNIYGWLIAILTIFAWGSANAQDMTLEEVLEAHYEVVGQERLSDVAAMKMEGRILVNGGAFELPMTIYTVRPGKYRTEAAFQGMNMVSVYDGELEMGYSINPMAGSMEPRSMTEQEMKSAAQQANMDGLLYNYEENGFEATYEGMDEVEGTEVHAIKLVNEEDETETMVYLDAEAFIILRTVNKAVVEEQEVESTIDFSNYKEQDGMVFPMSMEMSGQGPGGANMVIDAITVDPEYDEDLFEIPADLREKIERERAEEEGKEVIDMDLPADADADADADDSDDSDDDDDDDDGE